MAISLVGITTGNHSTGTITLSTHASTQVGDIVLAFCERDEGYATSAWTGNPFTLLRTLDAGHTAGTGGRAQIWVRTATAAGATSYSYTDSSGNSAGTVHLVVLRGALVPTAANTAAANNASSGSPTSPSVGSGTLDMLICGWGALVDFSALTFGVASSGLTSGGQVQDPAPYWAGFVAYGFGVAAGSKTISVSPAKGTRALSIYLQASAGPPQNVTLTGIASAEAFGTPTVVVGAVPIGASGIASAEAFGAAAVVPGAVPVGASGIGSAEAFGTPALQLGIELDGIDSGEAFGTPTINVGPTIGLEGIPSGEGFGALTLLPGAIPVGPTGIPSAEVFGALSLVPLIQPTGIPSAESFGTPALVVGAVPVGVAGIPTAEAFGAMALTVGAVPLGLTGIPSGEAFGTLSLRLQVVTTGIPTGEAFGALTVAPGPATLYLVGIPSGEAFGSPELVITVDPSVVRGAVLLRTGPLYELVCVARIPSAAGAPTFDEVERIVWRSMSWSTELSAPQSLSATVPYESISDPVAQRLAGPDRLATELWLSRDGQRVFAGPLLGWRRTGADVALSAAGAAVYMRVMIVLSDLRFDQTDQHLIAKALVDQWQAIPQGHYGIDTSAITPSGVLRDRSYVRNEIHEVLRRVQELGQVDGGFDHEVDPTTRRLQLWTPTMGVDRSTGGDAIVLDDRNIASPDIMLSVAPGDLASMAFGASTATGSDTSLWAAAVNADLRAAYGAAAVTGSWSDISEQATLDDHVAALLASRDQALVVPGPKARVTLDSDVGQYDVGDLIAVDMAGPLGISGAFRIRKRTVDVAESGEETVTLEFV